MLNIKTITIALLIIMTNTALAKEQVYIRDYNYQASDTDSKVSARNASLLFLKQNLLSEIGTYVGSNINIVSVASGEKGVTISSQQIKSLTEGFIKTEILEQKWNGVTYFIKAKMTADPDQISKKLKSIANKSEQNKTESSEEFDYWKLVAKMNAKEGYYSYINKYPEGKYVELAHIAVSRILAAPQGNKEWLIKQPGKVSLVVRHDTGWFDDLDPDIITREMGQTVKEMYKRFLPAQTTLNLITHFNETKAYQFNHKNQSQTECQRSDSDMIAGAMLNDYDGSDGMYRPIKLFIYDCKNNNFKISSFVPKVNSRQKFWREKALKKNLRVFIREYLDTI